MTANRWRSRCHGERPLFKALDEALWLPFSQYGRRWGAGGGGAAERVSLTVSEIALKEEKKKKKLRSRRGKV